MPGFTAQRRRARRAARRAGDGARTAVMPLAASLAALGERSWSGATVRDVPLDAVVGTVARTQDFDRAMRPLRRHLRRRWEQVAAAAPRGLPPVRLVQAGEMYFVVDGHHRVSVARAGGASSIEAVVRRVCTVAWACHCATLLDLPVLAAQRRFLERHPLPEDARPWLWLDDAHDWARVEQDARDWVAATTGLAGATDAERAAAWWSQAVVPSAHRCGGGAALRDHLCALRLRDAAGCCLA